MSIDRRTATGRAPPRFREARFEDYPQIHVSSPSSSPTACPRPTSAGACSWTTRCGRACADTWPIGWVLEDATGRIVGSLNNIPSAYLLDGEELLCANGHCWAVLPEYRGYATMLMDEYFGQEQPDVLVSAKVGSDATAVWSAYAQRVPVGDWSRAAYADHPVPRLRPRGPGPQAGPRRRCRGGGAGGGRRTAPQGQADRHGPRPRTPVRRVLRVPTLRRAVRRVLA